jgi:RNA polymerase sigma factor (sigma-70 family)
VPIPDLAPRTSAPPSPLFGTTHWSVVLAAGQGDSPKAAKALESLCRSYWYPLYAFARRAGHSPADAEDLTQGFFLHFLKHRLVARVGPEKGKFRSFLLVSFNHFLADQRDRAACQKRGGDQEQISLDASTGEQRYRLEPVELRDPQKQYELSWAMTVLDQVLMRLESEFAGAAKQRLFAALRSHLLAEAAPQTYTEIAQNFAMTESAVKGTVHRMRRRYRELFRDELSHTVTSREELDAEMRHLLVVVST